MILQLNSANPTENFPSRFYKDASDPSKITVLNKWSSMESAQKFVHSPELKAAMEKAGVQGAPSVSFLSEV